MAVKAKPVFAPVQPMAQQPANLEKRQAATVRPFGGFTTQDWLMAGAALLAVVWFVRKA